ncbi:WD40 repeat domain-containing protein [Dactylosporangium sp. CS-047395]|uniref:WD40 repeat domain-containing protein n=1 Tax=Dactylosporangium sp. CS-047395 TaxID=3239936 RepID=UPI003D9440A3
MDRFEFMVRLLRRGLTERAAQVRAEEPGAWLPRWTAGASLRRSMRQLHRFDRGVTAMALDDDSAWVLSGGAVHRVTIADGEVRRVMLEDPPDYCRAGAFTGSTVVGVDEDRLCAWDRGTGRLLVATDPADVPRAAGDLRSLAIAPGRAIVGTEGGFLLHFDLTSGARLAKQHLHDDGYAGPVAVSAGDPSLLLSAGGDNRPGISFQNHDFQADPEIAVPSMVREAVWTTVDGRPRAVTVDWAGTLAIWDPAAPDPVARYQVRTSGRGGLAITPDGSAALVGDGTAIRLVDLRDGTRRGWIQTDLDDHADRLAAHGPYVLAAAGGHANLLELADTQAEPLYFVDAAATAIDGQPAVVAVTGGGELHAFAAVDGRALPAPQRLPEAGRAGGEGVVEATAERRITLVDGYLLAADPLPW